MTPRTLLVVTPSLAAGGAERHAVRLATALDPTRWAPHVLALQGGPLRAELDAAGVPLTVVPVPGGRRAVPAAAAAVRAALDAVDPAVVSGHQVLTELAIRLALRRDPVPYLAWKHTYGHIGHRGLRERLLERTTGGAVSRYGAVCHSQVRYLTGELGLPADRIAVLPNAVPVPPVRPAPPGDGPPVVLMPAAMRADKDHALVLEAFRTVRDRWPRARLLLAGDGPRRAALERAAGPGVEFLGVRTDVEALLARAHVLVLASYAVECFPYAVLEAMAAARAVVSTAVGGLPELVDDGVTGRLVPPRDPAAFARAMLAGLADAPALGAAGWERVRRVYPLDRWADQVADLLDEVAGRPVRVPVPARRVVP